MLVLASPQAYFGESKEAKPDPDEPPLPFGDPENGENVVPLSASPSLRRGRGRPVGSKNKPKHEGAPADPPAPAADPADVPAAPAHHLPKANSLEELLTERHPPEVPASPVHHLAQVEQARSRCSKTAITSGKTAILQSNSCAITVSRGSRSTT